jgi:ABC-type polysaccharide transport system permease subunit
MGLVINILILFAIIGGIVLLAELKDKADKDGNDTIYHILYFIAFVIVVGILYHSCKSEIN